MKPMTIPELYDYLRSDHFLKQDGNIFYNYYIYQYPAKKEYEMRRQIQEFKEKLERRTGLPVYFWDERLTTVAADKAMMEAGIRRENRKDYVDMIAATLILQGYLDRRNNEKKKESE